MDIVAVSVLAMPSMVFAQKAARIHRIGILQLVPQRRVLICMDISAIMDTTQAVLLIALLIALGVAFRHWMQSRATRPAQKLARDVYPVWAAQGPFDSGARSASALRYAYLAVRGPEEAERMADAIAKHGRAFDVDPNVWERIRLESLDLAGPTTEDHVAIAKKLEAADRLNARSQ